MQNVNTRWIYPIILVCGALQAWGPPMNGALRVALLNPCPAGIVSFLPIVCLLGVVLLRCPSPLPNAAGLAARPWWAPLGGVIGAFAVVAGLLFADKVGAGVRGFFGLPVQHPSSGRIGGGLPMAAGIVLISGC